MAAHSALSLSASSLTEKRLRTRVTISEEASVYCPVQFHTTAHSSTPSDRPRRALIVVDAAAATLQKYLAAYGYETLTTTTDAAQRAIVEFAPDVAIIELHRGGIRGEDASIALARHLRAEPATYRLPLVFVWAEDERAVRSAAIYIGADDYFALSTPSAEILARLDALFWRVEAGRRAAPIAGDQRLEIDNFILLLDSVRDDIRVGTAATLGLIYAVAPDDDKALEKSARDHTLAQAHSFFKLNLRRIDAIAFYGPTTLLVYLPRTGSVAAIESLSKLRDQFLNDCQGCDVAIGLASFPDDGSEVERMIEKAEAAVAYARAGHRADRIMTYEASQMSPRPAPKRDFVFEPQQQQADTTQTKIDQTADTAEADRATARQSETADEQEEQPMAVPVTPARRQERTDRARCRWTAQIPRVLLQRRQHMSVSGARAERLCRADCC